MSKLLETHNFIRSIEADKQHLSYLKKKTGSSKIFSSRETRVLFGFLRTRLHFLAILLMTSFTIAIIEALRTLTIIGLIHSIVGDYTRINSFLKFDFMSISINLIDLLSLTTHPRIVIFLAACFIIACIFLASLRLWSAGFTTKVQLNLLRDVRTKALEKIFGFDLNYFTQAKSGELIHLINAETSRFCSIISFATNFCTLAFQFVFLGILLFYQFVDITIIFSAVSIMYFFFHLNIDRSLKVKSWKSNLAQHNLAHLFHQAIYGIKMIKIGSLEKREKEAFLKEHQDFENIHMSSAILGGLSRFSQEILFILVFSGIALYIYLTGHPEKYLGEPAKLTAYLFLLVRIIPVGMGLQQNRSRIINVYGPLSHVVEILEREDTTQVETESFRSPPNQKIKMPDDFQISSLSVQNISFTYNKEAYALSNINLDFPVNARIAFVGFSGSGKSTLLDLLSRVRLPQEGEIKLNGKPLSRYPKVLYQKLIGYLSQEPIIFHESIRYNVTFLKPQATEEEIWRALEVANIDSFVKALPDGLETGLGERGASLSGGERQRIGLARLFLQDAPILLLDEATNALDYESEQKIYQNLSQMSQGKIILVVAHRLNAVKDFDNIVVFSKGHVVEQGKHEALMANGSVYSSLYRLQEANY